MLTPIANVHHSRLPRPGAIVTVQIRPLQSGCRYRRFIVVAYPLSDAADQRYSCGIHTCIIQALDNGEQQRVAGHWCVEDD